MKEKNQYNAESLVYNRASVDNPLLIFDNLPDLIALDTASKILKRSVSTLYDWKYRGRMRKEKVPSRLFVKLGGALYLRKDVLKEWALYRDISV